MIDSLNCFSCNKILDLSASDKVRRSTECHNCTASIHSCMMCHFYSKNSYNECREPSAERITEKEKANYCDYYELIKPNPLIENNSLLEAAKGLFKN